MITSVHSKEGAPNVNGCNPSVFSAANTTTNKKCSKCKIFLGNKVEGNADANEEQEWGFGGAEDMKNETKGGEYCSFHVGNDAKRGQ